MMNSRAITQERLQNQGLAKPRCASPQEVVQWLGAVQAQDYGAATWALGLRLPGSSEGEIEAAFNAGEILRTHIMRPTWHFVTPADIRWLLKLTAPRVHALSAYYYRQCELDDALFAGSDEVISRALAGGKHLTRSELGAALESAGIEPQKNLRLVYLIGHAELEGLICSGARQGKQHTYALLEERAPAARMLERDEALAELARRYFVSHGPATLQDYVWWSGLATPDARAGLEMVKGQLTSAVSDGQTYWFAASAVAGDPTTAAYLLPNYDEYLVAYADRSAALDATQHDKDPRGNLLFSHTLIIDGQVAGIWKRTLGKDKVTLALNPFTELSNAERDAVATAAAAYGRFVGKTVVMA